MTDTQNPKPQQKNRLYVRQGEWIFTPAYEAVTPFVLHNETLKRVGGPRHTAQFMARIDGRLIYTSFNYPNGLSESAYLNLIKVDHVAKRLPWTLGLQCSKVYVKGDVTHPDYETLELEGWWQVLVITEGGRISDEFILELVR